MKQHVLPIVPVKGKFSRLVVSIVSDSGRDYAVILDSGAEISVWTDTESMLIKHYSRAIKQCNKRAILSGFGTDGEESIREYPVYMVPQIKLCDDLSLYWLAVAVCRKKHISPSLVLNLTALSNADIGISVRKHKITIISDDKLYCHNEYKENRYLESTYNFIPGQKLREFSEYYEKDSVVASDVLTQITDIAPKAIKDNFDTVGVIENCWDTYKKLHGIMI